MNKFKQFWKHDLTPQVEQERKEADAYEALADKEMNSAKRSTFRQVADSHKYNARQLEDADTTYQEARKEEVAAMNAPFAYKSQGVEKTGPSIHSAKWDECVADVKAKDSGKNAYAICTAKLNEESFKSQFKDLAYAKSEIKKARKAVGIGFAGDVPESLLAEQDLETTKHQTKEVITYRRFKIEVCEDLEGETLYFAGGEYYATLVRAKQAVDKFIENDMKKSVTSVENKIKNAVEDIEEADSTEEKSEAAEEVKDLQEKRQKAEIKERNMNKAMSNSELEQWAKQMESRFKNSKDIKREALAFLLDNADLDYSDAKKIVDMVKITKAKSFKDAWKENNK